MGGTAVLKEVNGFDAPKRVLATRWVMRALNASSYTCSRGSAWDPACGAYIAPQTPNWVGERTGVKRRERSEGAGQEGKAMGGDWKVNLLASKNSGYQPWCDGLTWGGGRCAKGIDTHVSEWDADTAHFTQISYRTLTGESSLSSINTNVECQIIQCSNVQIASG